MRVPILHIALGAAFLLVSCAGAAEPPALESENDKILYTLGVALSQNLATLDLGEKELALIQAGLNDGATGRELRVQPEVFGPKIQGMIQKRMAEINEKEKKAGEEFRAKLAEEKGAETTGSGLIYRELEAGEGASPGPSDRVKLHYHGTLRDGTVFDSSRDGDATPVDFPLNGVIGCFSEGVQKMKVGGKSKLTCPPEIAYGDRGSPPKIRPGATLVFEVELLEILAAPTPPTPATP